jgi:hypothetical protein
MRCPRISYPEFAGAGLVAQLARKKQRDEAATTQSVTAVKFKEIERHYSVLSRVLGRQVGQAERYSMRSALTSMR